MNKVFLWCLMVFMAGESATSYSKGGRNDNQPIVNTRLGRLRGTVMTTWMGKEYYAFRGIRYAKPPLGELRFKSPVPIGPWSGVVDAVEDGAVCYQPGGDFFGPQSEDCLYLNVYTNKLGQGNKAVIVFLHPGAFNFFTARSDLLGADYLLDEDLVLVTTNYRLGPLGFLSTGDETSVGNFGLKDQVAALRWVKDNIPAFGGDPQKVTLTGYSIGSSSVMLHMMSPMSKGLFKRGFAMSAGVTADWLLNERPLDWCRRLAALVNCTKDDVKEMVQCLRQVPARTLAEQHNNMKEWGSDPTMQFAAVIEPETIKEERFLLGRPTDLIRSRNFQEIPLVLGIARNEFDGSGLDTLKNETLRNDLNTDFNRVAPIAFGYERGTEKSKMFSSMLRKSYMDDKPFSESSIELGNMYSDALIIFHQTQSAKLFTKYSRAPVFFYMTTYVGRFSNYYKEGTNEPLGVAHHDEMLYLFYPKVDPRFKDRFNETDPEAKMIKAFTSAWSNFANTGNPTPDNAEGNWNPMTLERPCYLDFGDVIKMTPGLPFKERVAVWEFMFPTFPTARKQ